MLPRTYVFNTISVGLVLQRALASTWQSSPYVDFDKAMSKVKAATHVSTGDMELLLAAAIKAGEDTSYSEREAVVAITELSRGSGGSAVGPAYPAG